MKVLDEELKKQNSDYEAKRYRNYVLHFPRLTIVKSGTFDNWLRKNNKLGAQHKVPRLMNDPSLLHEILHVADVL